MTWSSRDSRVRLAVPKDCFSCSNEVVVKRERKTETEKGKVRGKKTKDMKPNGKKK
jgi:hypothetical protein